MAYIRETREFARQHPTERNKYWCKNCETWVHINQMDSRVLDDDETVEKSCDGCDLVLLEFVVTDRQIVIIQKQHTA